MSKNKFFIASCLCVLSFIILQCSAPKTVRLEEIKTQKIPDVKKLPPLRGMISEIELVKGEQKYIYIKLGNSNEWYKEGLIGFAFNDVAMTEKIAKFRVVEVYPNYSKGEIIELNYIIKDKAIEEVEIDPRFLTK